LEAKGKEIEKEKREKVTITESRKEREAREKVGKEEG